MDTVAMLKGIYFRPEGAKRIWPGAQRVFERSPRMGVQQVTSPDGAKGIQDVVHVTELSPCLLDQRSTPLAGAGSHAAPARISRRDPPKPRRLLRSGSRWLIAMEFRMMSGISRRDIHAFPSFAPSGLEAFGRPSGGYARRLAAPPAKSFWPLRGEEKAL